MYQSWPVCSEVKPEVTHDNQFGMKLEIGKHVCPDRISKLLVTLGWESTMNDPDTDEMLWQKKDPNMTTDFDPQLNSGYWFWYEAIAYEFAKMMSLGMDA